MDKTTFPRAIDEHIGVARTLSAHSDTLVSIASKISQCIRNGGKVLVCGNGGSAADAQHFAGELVGRYTKERRAWPVIALTTDTSVLTAVGNDYSFDRVFDRQVEALGKKGDVLVAISTSGNSPNVLRAVEKAKAQGMRTVALLGKDGGQLRGQCDLEIIVSSNNTPRIQEMHILIIHTISDLVEQTLTGD